MLAAAVLVASTIGLTASDPAPTDALDSHPLPALDTSFGVGGLVNLDGWSDVLAVAEQPGQRLVVLVESRDRFGRFIERGLVRLTPSGAIDPTFAASGPTPGTLVLPTDTGERMLLRSSGEILLSGSTVRQYTADGGVDTSFAAGGAIVEGLFGPPIELDDHTLILSNFGGTGGGGMMLQHRSARGELLPGGLVFTWVPPTEMVPVRLADGSWRLLTSGDANYPSPWGDNLMIALTKDGAIDTAWGGGDGMVSTGSDSTVVAGAVTTSGKIVIATTDYSGGDYTWAVSRYLDSGSPDTAWAGGGTQRGDGELDSMSLNEDGSFTLGVSHATPPPELGANDYLASVKHLRANGLVDTAFNPNGLQAGAVWLAELGISGHSIGSAATPLTSGQVIVARTWFSSDPVPKRAELVRMAIPSYGLVHEFDDAGVAYAPAQRLGRTSP